MLLVCGIQSLGPWWSAVGILMDFLGFGMLAYDVIQTVKSEREAWRHVETVRRAAFSTRYAILAPPVAQQQKQVEAFETELDKERRQFETAMMWRYVRVSIGIALVQLGFAFQGLGAIPCG